MANLNIRGTEKISTKCGIFASLLLISILVYDCLFSFIEIVQYNRLERYSQLEYGAAVDKVFDFTELAKNLAFRVTSHYGQTKHASIDPTIAEWVVVLESTKNRNYAEM